MTARTVLKEALLGTIGWRVRARRVLGLERTARCPMCMRYFDLGRSAHGKTCGRPGCQREYHRRSTR